ncbi:hypothetical protein GGI25_005361 [Coemansia spiralis]|uniref:DUF4097 domain-containing protein n=2 Tax=Coemansia TaxID=4863 RepID=A0A9W8G3Z9_9FUNG|nr:hypothetical protein BX070DRAFT_237899 [Coemansia spiralis]KAJ1988361.1 hypothetical protein EDC05_005335 [Coemansia umbellata]KAJ2619681.1 hypothetical protein GGI26_005633 [Coemansia sp. RSA 1358]KAJ2671810.1 hypothetical protein GGI25_005361 [Coemansia spiralis]
MTDKKNDSNANTQKGFSRYRLSSSFGRGVSFGSPSSGRQDATQESQTPNDMPPPYSAVDPNTQQPAASTSQPPPFNSETDLLNSINEFLFDRPLCISTGPLFTSTVLFEQDADIKNGNLIRINVEMSPTDSANKVKAISTINRKGEYEFKIDTRGLLKSGMQHSCTIKILLPAFIQSTHPGLSIDLAGGSITMANLSHIRFQHINMQLSNSKVIMAKIASSNIRVSTTNGAVNTTDLVAEVLDINGTNTRVEIHKTQAGAITISTTNSCIALDSLTATSIKATAVNTHINCTDVDVGDMQLQTTKAMVKAENVIADSLSIKNLYATVAGSWTIGRLLEVTTSIARISGTVAFKKPLVPAHIALHTTTCIIDVALPAETFAGYFNALTNDSYVVLKWKGSQLTDTIKYPPVRFEVDDVNEKRGTIGKADPLPHYFSAYTTHSQIEIDFE